jgi:hypothetical protein
MNTRVAVYARVSTTNHGQDIGLQTRELRQFAEARRWQIAGGYIDAAARGLGKALGLRTKRLQETVTKKLKRWRYEIRLFLRCVHGSAQTEVRQLPLVGDEETKMAANQDLVIVGGRGHVGVLQSLLGKSRSARTKMKAPGVKP